MANICILYSFPTTQNLIGLEFVLSKSLKDECEDIIVTPRIWFPLNDVKIVTYDLNLRLNLCDLEFDLSRSLKVSCDGAIGLPPPPPDGFRLMFHINIGTN